MDHVTLGQYMQSGSIWGGIQALEPFPFLVTTPPAKMDILLELGYGEQWMFHKLGAKPVSDVCATIVALYKDQWLRLIEVQALDIDIGSGLSKKQTETISKKEVRNNSRDDVNKVSAFNSDELINNDGSVSTGLDDLKGDTTRTLTDSQISLVEAFNNLNLLGKSNILNTVNKDVASFLTLDIY